MTELFLDILNLSICAGWLILAVLALRLALKKAPKWINVLLWGLVAARLLCPFSIESALSLIPSAETFPERVISGPSFDVQTGIAPVDDRINNYLGDRYFEGVTVPANNGHNVMTILAIIWIIGIAAMALYTAISYWQLRRKVDTAIILRDNIFQSEHVTSPFVLGIVEPKIYLPFRMDEQDLQHVIAHELSHIRRRDHWWKPLGFGLLTIHWFNPLIWLAYILLCRDIELACDEKVIRELGSEQRADYTQALLTASINRKLIAACPLAFGEVGVKERVKHVMNYKKPAFWVIASALILCALAAVSFLTIPENVTDSDIFEENGYTVIGQEEVPVTLCIDKAMLPDSIYTAQGYEFDENQVVAYSTETSSVYLYKAMISNESDDLLYFIFNIAYDIPKSGSILSPYKHMGGGSVSPILRLQSEDLRDVNATYPDALSVRAHGPGNQFAFYVSKEACQAANGTLMIDVVCNRIFYTSEQSAILMAKVLDIEDGFFVVEPVAGSRELRTASRILVPMENMEPSPEPQIGDILQIEYDGNLMETYPAQIGKVSHISVISESTQDLPRQINIDGILYIDTGEAIPAEVDPSAILGTLHTQVEGRPANHGQGSFECEGCPYARVEGDYTVLIDNEWYRFTEEVLTSPEYYLTIAEEGAVSIEIRTGSRVQVISNDDLSAYSPGESVLLPVLTGKENLRGVTITVRDADNDDIFGVSISAKEHGAADAVIECGEWIITPKP